MERLNNAMTITIQLGGQTPETEAPSLKDRLMTAMMKRMKDPSPTQTSEGRLRTEGSWRPYVG